MSMDLPVRDHGRLGAGESTMIVAYGTAGREARVCSLSLVRLLYDTTVPVRALDKKGRAEASLRCGDVLTWHLALPPAANS